MKPLVLGALVAGAAAVHSPAGADVRAGIEAWQQGDYGRAVAQWQPLAQAGDTDAMFNLGQAYKLGRGVPKSLETALAWYRKAADKGHERAEDDVGLLLFQLGEREAAMPYVRRSADRGDPRALYILATAMFNGDYAPKDWVGAYALMARAAAGGLSQAETSLTAMNGYLTEAQRREALARVGKSDISAPAFEAAHAAERTAAAEASEWTRVAPAQEGQVAMRTPEATAATPGPEPESAAPEPAPLIAAADPPAIASPVPDVPPPHPVSAPPSPRARPVGPHWRAQFGGFHDEDNARRLWSRLIRSLPELADLEPHYVRGRQITRLQAGAMASQADAAKLCGRVRAKGFECLIVRHD